MVDSSGLKRVGLIFASVTFAVMLTTTMLTASIRWGQPPRGDKG